MISSLRNYYLDTMGITRWALRQTIIAPSMPEDSITSLDVSGLITWYQQQESSSIIFLADIHNAAEQELFSAITQACATGCKYSSGKLLAEITDAQDFLATFPISTLYILVFGVDQAKLLDLTFAQRGLFNLGSIKIYVTYTLQELAMQPAYKKELWQTWKTLNTH